MLPHMLLLFLPLAPRAGRLAGPPASAALHRGKKEARGFQPRPAGFRQGMGDAGPPRRLQQKQGLCQVTAENSPSTEMRRFNSATNGHEQARMTPRPPHHVAPFVFVCRSAIIPPVFLPRPRYSCRSASTGFIRAARRAG